MPPTLTDEDLQRLIPWTFKRRGGRVNRENPYVPRVRGAVIEHEAPVRRGEPLKLVFENSNSDWIQGVCLRTNGTITVDGGKHRQSVVIFHRPSHPELDLVVESKEGILWVWNVWDYRANEVAEPPGSIASHQNYCGMIVEKLPNGYRYLCNEGRDDDDYDDLIFRIERTGIVEPPRRGGRRKSLGGPRR